MLRNYNTIIPLIYHNYPWTNEVKQMKINQEKLSQGCIFFPTAKDPDAGNGDKKQI